MTFDPIEYLINKIDAIQSEITVLRAGQVLNQTKIGRLESKIESLEQWQQSLQTLTRRWPMVLGTMILIVLNIAPAETIKAVAEAVQAVAGAI